MALGLGVGAMRVMMLVGFRVWARVGAMTWYSSGWLLGL